MPAASAEHAKSGAAARVASAELRGAAAAIAFLTRVPLGGAGSAGPRAAPGPCTEGDAGAGSASTDLARGVVFFPLVGAALGAGVGAIAVLLAGSSPPLVAAGVALALAALVTGGLHLDGLADSADALGARTREQALAIMRDARTGSFGAAALVLVLLVQAAALAALATEREVGAVAAAFALSRAVGPCIACLLPYARPGPGLGQALAGGSRLRAACAALLACALAVALAPGSAIALSGAALAVWAAGLLVCARRFGGVTGDTLGAAIAIAEAACLAAAAS